MDVGDEQGVVEVSEVEVLRNSGRSLLCRIRTAGGARTVAVPPFQMRLGTTIRYPGDRGRLVISQGLAADLGLAAPAVSSVWAE